MAATVGPSSKRNALHPGLAQLVDDDPERQERQQRADDAQEDQERQHADDRVPVRDHELGHDLEEPGPHLVERVDDRHDGMLPEDGRPRRGLPRFVVAPRPGFQRCGSTAGSRSSCGRVARRPAVADGRRRQLRPLEPAEQPRRARRPGTLGAQRRPEGVVVADHEQRAGRRRSRNGPRLVHQGEQAPRRRCAGRSGARSVPAATRSPRMPRSGAPSNTSSMPMAAGTIARNRPINAACGAAPGLRDRAWRRLVPSMRSRSVPVSGSRGSVVTTPSYAGSGRRLRSAA